MAFEVQYVSNMNANETKNDGSGESEETYVKTKPCAQCGTKVPSGCLVCSPCQRDNMMRFRESHPWLFVKTP